VVGAPRDHDEAVDATFEERQCERSIAASASLDPLSSSDPRERATLSTRRDSAEWNGSPCPPARAPQLRSALEKFTDSSKNPPADAVPAGGLGDCQRQPVETAKICMADASDAIVLLISGKATDATVLDESIGTVVA
jgi:hypothetical protein